MQQNLRSFKEVIKSLKDDFKSYFLNFLLKLDSTIAKISKNQKMKDPIINLSLVVFIALLAGGAYLVHRHISPVYSSDSVIYLRTAKYIYLEHVYRGDGTPPYFLDPGIENNPFLPMPMYPLILAAFFYLFGYTLESATLVSPFFGSLIIIMTYFVASKVFNKQVGLLSALMLTFVPYFWFYATKIFVEVTQTLFFLLALYFLYLSPKTKKSLIVLGIFSNACFLTRPNGILIYPIIFLTLFVRKELKIKFIAIIIIASLLPILPWLIYSIVNQQSIFGGYGWLEGYVKFLMRGQIGYIIFSDAPDRAFTALMGIPAITTWQILTFSTVGILIVIGKESKVGLQLLIAMSIISWSAARYFYIRYWFLIIPLFVILAAYGIIKIYEYIFQDMATFPYLVSFTYLLVILLGLSLSLYVMGDYFVRTSTWLSLNLTGPSLVAPISFSPIFIVPIVIIATITALMIASLSQDNRKNRIIAS